MNINQPSIYSSPSYAPKKVKAKAEYYDMIVFSPVRWNFNYQRSHYIVSQMAKKRKVLFVELPIDFNAEDKGVNLISINNKITVLQPKLDSLNELRDIIASYVTNEDIPVGLFFSPVFSSFIEVFAFDKIVYDCVNDPIRTTDHSFEMTERENHLITEADLILTNEQKIYDSKYQDHPHVHCLPNLEEQYNGKPLPTAILDRTAERMEILIRSCRNYGVLI